MFPTTRHSSTRCHQRDDRGTQRSLHGVRAPGRPHGVHAKSSPANTSASAPRCRASTAGSRSSAPSRILPPIGPVDGRRPVWSRSTASHRQDRDRGLHQAADRHAGHFGQADDRGRKGERIEIPIVRDNIKTKSVKGFHREESDANRWMFLIDPVRRIGYIRLTQFTPASADEMAKALESACASEGKLAGLVLDLRQPRRAPATRIADMFLREGVIVSTTG